MVQIPNFEREVGNVLDSGEPGGIQLSLLGRQSMLALEGKPHQRERKLLTPLKDSFSCLKIATPTRP
ncbi:hypothetical protein SD80_026595 [Scytonema tolypothrichoides VB-61278]|nr:hypothetical protein SD80_026595 [Scytonema tolypothrichoides VB-61278]